jgi:hypothetical protein
MTGEIMKLRGYEEQAFKAWSEVPEDFSVMGFQAVSERTGLDKSKVRRAVRGLSRKGLLQFFRTSWTDDGAPHGAGYGLTKQGVEFREFIERP